jgi:uncharacterized protein (TIGR02001 family)
MPLDLRLRSRRSRWLVLVLLQATMASGLADARAEPVEFSFGVASATVLRGVALGEGGVDVHAAAQYAHPSGWRASLGVTALHSKVSRGPRWDAQWFGRLGYAHRLDDDWSAQLAGARYSYTGSDLLRDYAHDELGATLAYRDLLYVSIAGLRRSQARGGRHSVAYDLVVRQALPAALSASAGLGRLEGGGDPGYAYSYGHLGLGAQWGLTQAQLSYIATSATAKQRFGSAASNRWTASLEWHF